MTDPMTELRQASAEVSGVEVLSPAAQAVKDAFLCDCQISLEAGIATALRAAANQVVGARFQNETERRIYVRLRRIAAKLSPTTTSETTDD